MFYWYRIELTGLTVYNKVAVVLPEAASVIVIDCERRVVIGQEEIAADVVPRGNGRGGAVAQGCDVRNSVPAPAAPPAVAAVSAAAMNNSTT